MSVTFFGRHKIRGQNALFAVLSDQKADQTRLQGHKQDDTDHNPLVLLKKAFFPVGDNAALRQTLLRNSPAFELPPVEHQQIILLNRFGIIEVFDI